VLVHGYSDDAGTWWRVAPALADRGWTVLAPELRGHGQSARADSYELEDFAGDLVDTLPSGADLLLGHSLGAMAVALAVPALEPRLVVLVDPAWLRPWRDFDLARTLPTTRAELGVAAEGWDDGDVAADLASNARLDPRVAEHLLTTRGPDAHVEPAVAHVLGSVVLVPEHEPALPPESHDPLAMLGYELRTVPGVGHVMHRDDLTAFMAVLPLEDEVPA
jgi:pimeloyl-ACP methyl ester carboxylesterase